MKKKYVIGLALVVSLGVVYSIYAYSTTWHKQETHKVAYVEKKSEKKQGEPTPDQVNKEEGIDAEQIVVKITDQGYVTSHGDHYHYYNGKVPYDAIFSEELIMKDPNYQLQQEDIINEVRDGYVIKVNGNYYLYLKDPNHTVNVRTKAEILRQKQEYQNNKKGSSATTAELKEAQAQGRYTTDDGYIFNPTDVLEDTGDGYIVLHLNHYHFIPKSDLSANELAAAQAYWNGRTTNPSKTNKYDFINHQIVVPNQNQSQNNQSGNSSGITIPETNNIQELLRFLNSLPLGYRHVESDGAIFDPTKVTGKNNFGYVFPHGNHFHIVPFSQLSQLERKITDLLLGETPSSPTIPDKKEEQSLDDKLEQKIQAIMNKYHISRDKIRIDRQNNAIVYPHGDHYHYEAIDDSKPLNHSHEHHHNFEEPKGDPSIETQKMFGPIFVKDRKEFFSVEDIIKNYGIQGIKDKNNYKVIAFSVTESKNAVAGGSLIVGNQAVKHVVYLVLQNEKWSDLPLSVPTVKPDDGYYFKYWYGAPGDEGDRVERSRIYSANFGQLIHKNSPITLGPLTFPYIDEKDYPPLSLRDYIRVDFHLTANGIMKIGDVESNHFFYFIKENKTWEEAEKAGFKLPEVIPNPGYEFIGWGNGFSGESKVSSRIVQPFIGTTTPIIGPYQPTDKTKPLDPKDPNRLKPHNHFAPYDKNKYVAVAFTSEGQGNLYDLANIGDSLVYLVRKGTKMSELTVPEAIGDEGYHADWGGITFDNNDTPIQEDTTFKVTFKKNDKNATDSKPEESNAQLSEGAKESTTDQVITEKKEENIASSSEPSKETSIEKDSNVSSNQSTSPEDKTESKEKGNAADLNTTEEVDISGLKNKEETAPG